MWIKICGNTSLQDARLAVESGADALGFVFAPSPRQVTEAQVRQIASALPPHTETYGVFVNSSFARIVAAVSECGLTGVQLHRTTETGLSRRLREHFAGLARKLSIVRVVDWNTAAWNRKPDRRHRNRNGEELKFDRLLGEASGDPTVDAVLVDSSTAAAVGGTGTTFDWAATRDSILRAAPRVRLIVAGGLCPENVKQAISTLRPWGVDVASGVEASPGKKDGARLLAFVQAARQAAEELGDIPAPNVWENRPQGKQLR